MCLEWRKFGSRTASLLLAAAFAAWLLLSEAPLTIEGRRVDGGDGTFHADLPPMTSYPLDLNLHIGPGFIPSNLEFSSAGCWKVIATLGSSRVVLYVNLESPRRAGSV